MVALGVIVALMTAAAFWLIVFFLPIKTAAVVFSDTSTCQLPSTFSLKWRHSVEKQYWQEVYQVKFSQLILTKTYLQTFGAGTPSTGTPTPAPQGYLGEMVNMPMNELNWLVSNNMQGEILMGDALTGTHDTLPIYQLVSDHSEVIIKPMQLTLWQNWHFSSCQSLTNPTHQG